MGWEADLPDEFDFEDLTKKQAEPKPRPAPLLAEAETIGDQAYSPFAAFATDENLERGTPQRFPTELRAWTPEERARLEAQKPAIGKVDKGGERPGFFGILGESGRRGAVEGLTSVAEAPTAFRDRAMAEMPKDEIAQLMAQPASEGWSNPRWWAAHIAHGTAASSPSLAAGAVGATAGGAVGGPAGALAGGAGGFGIGSLVQSLAPSYQRARAAGLDHEAAVDRAITESGISGVAGAAMGLAPALRLFGTTAEGALKRPISEALAQIFGVQPGIGMAGTVASRAATGQALPTADELATQYATQVGTGAVLTGMQTGARAAPRWWEAARDRWMRGRESEIPVTPLTRAESLPAQRFGPGEIDFGDLIPDRTRLAAPSKRIGTDPSEPAPQAGAESPPPASPLPGEQPPVSSGVTPEVLPASRAAATVPEITVEAAPVPPTIRANVIAETLRQMQAMPQVSGLVRAEQQRTGENMQQVLERLVSQGPLADQFAQTANEVALTGKASRSAQPLAKAIGEELAKSAEDVRATEPPAQPQAQPAGQRGVDVLQFIRANGGLKPARELSALDARRYPGLINRNGLDADKMREKMVEAGYLQEAGPDQPAITTPADVYDLLSRSISGERIVPAADQAGDEAFSANRVARDARRELQAAERTFVRPEIARYDAEIGGEGLWKAYQELSPDDKNDVIDRNRRGADIVDLLEEKTLQNPLYYALGAPIKRAKVARDELGFYSKAVESAKALKQEKGAPEQMLAQLESAGVKNNEIAATGLDRMLLGEPIARQRRALLQSRNEISALKNELADKANPPTPQRMAEIGASLATAEPALIMAIGDLAEAIRAMPKRTVSKMEIMDFLDENRVTLKESSYGGADIGNINQISQELYGTDYRHLDPESQADVQNEQYARTEGDYKAKWRDYSLDPSNPTYRESVIHLPGSGKMPPYKEWLNNRRSWGGQHEDTPSARAEYETKVHDGYATQDDFKSGHWDEPNVVAHVRTALYTDTKGRKVFDIDELQSDWGQKIRDGEARDEEKITRLKESEGKAVEAYNAQARKGDELFAQMYDTLPAKTIGDDVIRHRQRIKEEGVGFNTNKRALAISNLGAQIRDQGFKDEALELREWNSEFVRLGQEVERFRAELNTARADTPAHPLVSTTDQWATTAMRRLIQQAVDSGADGISITPGKVQNERYDLEKHVSSIDVMPLNWDGKPARQVVVNAQSGIVASGHFTPDGKLFKGHDAFGGQEGKSLGDLIGKELADRILAASGVERFSGEGLKVGGDGMRATYDRIYPRILLKLVQKLDPSVRPEKTRLLPSGDRSMARAMGGQFEGNEAFANDFTFIPLTDKAKEKLADEAQPMFALGAHNGRNKRAGDRAGRDESGGLAPLKGAPIVAGATGPDPRVVAAAEDYARSIGIDLKRQAVFAEIDEALATRIAQAYEEMSHNPRDPQVRAAYDDMIVQTINQYRALERAGYKFFFYDEQTDPYAGNPWNSIRDLRENQRMGVFATEAGFGSGATDLDTSDSPMLVDTGIQWPYGLLEGPQKRVLANDLFRAVHDAFGHSIEGAGFRARGEENAWQAHIRLYTGLAQGAVTTETRGQNSWLNFGPYGEANRNASVEDTVFADQKLGLMPEWSWMEGRTGDADADVSYALEGFYSPAIRTVEKIKQDKATPEQWWSMVSKTPGVRQEELNWMGLKEWLDEQGTTKKSVAKQGVLDFMEEHQMELEDKLLGAGQKGSGPTEEEIDERAREIFEELEEKARSEAYEEWLQENDPDDYKIDGVDGDMPGEENRKIYKAAEERLADAVPVHDLFVLHQQLSLPGIPASIRRPQIEDFLPNPWLDENGDLIEIDWGFEISHPHRGDYSDSGFATKEEAQEAADAKLEELKQEAESEEENWDHGWEAPHSLEGEARRQAREELGDPDGDDEGGNEAPQYRKYAIPGGQNYGELLITLPDMQGIPQTHYKAKEIVHVRFDEREGPKGEKVIFVHEIQSDLHQRARDFGYGEEGIKAAEDTIQNSGWTMESLEKNNELADQRNAVARSVSRLFLPGSANVDPAFADEYGAIQNQVSDLDKQMSKLTEAARKRENKARTYKATFGLKGAPDVPYKGNNWWELAFKRMVQYAVDKDFDAIALTTPKQIMDATYTPETAANQFYGKNLPTFAEKYLKKWGIKPSKAALSGTESEIEWQWPEDFSKQKAIDYYSSIRAIVLNRSGDAAALGAANLSSIIAGIGAESDADVMNAIERSSSALAWAKQGVPGRVTSLLQQVRTGKNPYYRITEAMKKDINDLGQALAINGEPETKMKQHIGSFTKLGRSVDVPHADAVLRQAEAYAASVPAGVTVAALARIEPVKGKKGYVRTIFKTQSGEVVTGLEAPWEAVASMRAFFRPGQLGEKGGVFLIRFAHPGESDKRLGGEVRHESIHALRRSGALPAAVWSRLLGHAKKLRLLESDLRTYLQAIGNPDYRNAQPGKTIIRAYMNAYKGLPDLNERIDQEYVAHMAELYSHGQLLPQEVGEISDDLDDIFSGVYSGQQQGEVGIIENRPVAAFAGPWAKTAKETPLILAKKLAELGKPKEEIWKKTGWFQGADGKWRFEIDDKLARIKISPARLMEASKTGAEANIGALLDHPELLDAYPELKNMHIYLEPEVEFTAGGHRGRTAPHDDTLKHQKFIVLGMRGFEPTPYNVQLLLSTLLHELQHEIQDIENFATGGSPAKFRDDFLERLGSGRLSEMDRRIVSSSEIAPTYKNWLMSARGAAKEPGNSELRELTMFMLGRLTDMVAFEHYKRLAGEVEAREVQHRLPFGEESRKTIWPMPVPAEEQNVQFPWADDRYSDVSLALAGPRAIGAPKAAMQTAEGMEARGRDPEAIWQSTGVARGIEGKQRWEIDDSGAKIIGLDKAFETPKKAGFLSRLLGRAPAPKPGIKEANNVPLLNVLHHPKLFNAYPFLRQMRVNLAYGDQALKEGSLRRVMGPFTADNGKTLNVRIYKPIEASGSTPQDLLEVLMHEIQHYIQDREGFARGADFVSKPATKFGEKSNALYDPGKDLSEEERNSMWNVNQGETLLKMTRPESLALDLMSTFERLDALDPGSRDYDYEQENIKRLGERLEESMLVKGGDDYLSSFGEYEARAVEKRIGMTPEQRRETSPFAGMPEKLRDTSSQTRDYQKAYDEVMRRAQVFKQIKERWKDRQDLGNGVSVVRPDEELLVYTQGRDKGLIEARLLSSVATAEVNFWPEFFGRPYHQQKSIMDVAMRDLRGRNVRPMVGEEPNDNEIAFWGRYDPRLVAFDPRFYTKEIEAMAREQYGDDVKLEFYNDGQVVATTPEMQQKYQAYRQKVRDSYKAYEDFLAKMVEKYGSVDDMFQKGDSKETQKYHDLARKADDFGPSGDEKPHAYIDLSPIFGDRNYRSGSPKGVDRDLWHEMLIDEQLAHMDKMPRPGDEFDFSNLIPAQ